MIKEEIIYKIVENFLSLDEDKTVKDFLKMQGISYTTLIECRNYLYNNNRTIYIAFVKKMHILEEKKNAFRLKKVAEYFDDEPKINDPLFAFKVFCALPIKDDQDSIKKTSDILEKYNIPNKDKIINFMGSIKMDKPLFYEQIEKSFLANKNSKGSYRGVLIDNHVREYIFKIIKESGLPEKAGIFEMLLNLYINEEKAYKTVLTTINNNISEEDNSCEVIRDMPYTEYEDCYEIAKETVKVHNSINSQIILEYMKKNKMNNPDFFKKIDFNDPDFYKDDRITIDVVNYLTEQIAICNLPSIKGVLNIFITRYINMLDSVNQNNIKIKKDY